MSSCFGPAPIRAALAGVRRHQADDAEIHLSEHAGDAPGPGLLYIWVEAVDPLAAITGAKIDAMPWARDFEVADPDGNRLQFAKRVPD